MEGLVGVAGVVGEGAGRAGDEYEREPRLPPPVARAQALPASTTSRDTSATPSTVNRA
jgi:hypothetical protein